MISLKVCRAPLPVSARAERGGPRAPPGAGSPHFDLFPFISRSQGCLPRFDGDSAVCAPGPAVIHRPLPPGPPGTGRARRGRDAAASRAWHRHSAGRGGEKKPARRCQGTAHAGHGAHGAVAGAVGDFLGGTTPSLPHHHHPALPKLDSIRKHLLATQPGLKVHLQNSFGWRDLKGAGRKLCAEP